MSEGGVATQLYGVPAGPELVAMLAALGPVRSRDIDAAGVPEIVPDTSEQVLIAQAWQRALAWMESRLDDAVLQIAGAWTGVSEDDWGREEIAAGLRWSGLAAADRLEVARALRGRCVLTGTALAAGLITYRHAAEIVHALEPLDDETAAVVEARLLDAADTLTPAQLARKARKEVAKADPAGAEKRHRRARNGRRVDFHPLPDAMAELRAILPADDAARLRATIDQFAGRTRSGDDKRTIDQRRADALVALAEVGAVTAASVGAARPANSGASHATAGSASAAAGSASATAGSASATAGPASATAGLASAAAGPADAAAGGSEEAARVAGLISTVLAGKRAVPPRIALTAPLSTVLGATNRPGDLTGYGPVPASIVRELAAQSSWEKWVTDPGGVVTDLGRTTYRPTARLAALIRATYPTCMFPGCSQPAYRCDLDHNVRRIDGGPTSTANIVPLCRRHHRAKDEAGWELVHHPDTGVCTWTSPAGHTYTVAPPDQSDEPASELPADWTQPLSREPALAGVATSGGADDPPPF
ncbi:HNH endonuclease signature motif containing protein [Cryptosporangium minutisporangium]